MATAHFGERIKELRSKLGLKQEDLAAAAGISQPAVSKAEAAEKVEMAGRKETVERIATALGTNFDALVGQPRFGHVEPPTGLAVRPPAPRFVVPPRAALPPSRSARILVGADATDVLARGLGRGFSYGRHDARDMSRVMAWISSNEYDLRLAPHSDDQLTNACTYLLDAAATLRVMNIGEEPINMVIATALAAGKQGPPADLSKSSVAEGLAATREPVTMESVDRAAAAESADDDPDADIPF